MGMRSKDRMKYAAISAGMMLMCAGTAIASTIQAKPIERVTAPAETVQIAELVEVTQPQESEAKTPAETTAAKPTTVSKAAAFTDAERLMLARIAMAEAEGEGVEGKALVIKVVLNRVEDADFPNGIESVIFQKRQFSTVNSGGRYWTREPDAGCYEAIAMVETGWDESQGALYFESTHNTSAWHKNHLRYLFQKGNHIFYTRK